MYKNNALKTQNFHNENEKELVLREQSLVSFAHFGIGYQVNQFVHLSLRYFYSTGEDISAPSNDADNLDADDPDDPPLPTENELPSPSPLPVKDAELPRKRGRPRKEPVVKTAPPKDKRPWKEPVVKTAPQNDPVPGPSRLLDMPEVGNFVSVRYDYAVGKQTKERIYIGKVLNISSDYYEVTFLRPFRNEPNTFVFPNIEDIDVVPRTQIQACLQDPNIVARGRFHFTHL